MTRSVGPLPGPGSARIAVDLLGGDNAPAVVVDGALRACRNDPDLRLLLVGPRPVADEILSALDPADRDRVRAHAAERGVRMSDPAKHGADSRTSRPGKSYEL